MLWNVDPWRELDRMRRTMDTLFSRAGVASIDPSFPLLNAHDSSEFITVVAELPGVSKENVSITMNNSVLTVAGKREPRNYGDKAQILRRERPSGAFEKSLRIPSKVSDSAISATFKEGILTIRLPKSEEAKARQISIQD